MEEIDIKQVITNFFTRYPRKTYDKGEVVIFADNTVPPVFFVEEGVVMQCTISDSGNKLTLNMYKPGTFFPMSAALNETPNTYFFEAVEHCVVRQAPSKDAAAFLEDNPAVALDLLKRVYRGTDGLLARLAELMAGDAAGRIYNELVIASRRFGTPQENGDVTVRITENQLAQQTGLARETVSKELSKFKKAGQVTLERGHITLHAQK